MNGFGVSSQVIQPESNLSAYGVVVIGASAGGIPALIELLSALPACFPVPIFIVQHLSPDAVSSLAGILDSRTRLSVKWAEQCEEALPGIVYVAPPGKHLIVGEGMTVFLSSAAKCGLWRPAVDVLFASAAKSCGRRAIGIVLSGTMWDGARGMAEIAEVGGITIAQDARTSAHFEMPAAAIDIGRADLVLSIDKIADILTLLINSEIEVYCTY